MLLLLDTHQAQAFEMSTRSPWTWCLVNVLCFPLKLLINHWLAKHESPHAPPPPYEPVKPPSALPARSRPLSMTADDFQRGKETKIALQLQSPLLRLPKEIRLQIYEQAIGRRFLHIKLRRKGFKGRKAPYIRCYTCMYGEKHIDPYEWTICHPQQEFTLNYLLPLLQCCRYV